MPSPPCLSRPRLAPRPCFSFRGRARADGLIALGMVPGGRRHVDNPSMHRSDHGQCAVCGLAVIYETTVVYIMPSPHRPLTAVYRCFLVTSDAVKSASDGALGHRRRKSTRRCTSTARIMVSESVRCASARLILPRVYTQVLRDRRRARTEPGSRDGRSYLRHIDPSLSPFDTTQRR
jgi:hypothetical protein